MVVLTAECHRGLRTEAPKMKTRDTLKDPQVGDRFVITQGADKYEFDSKGRAARCWTRTPKMVTLRIRRGGLLMPYHTCITVRLSTLAKIARTEGEV